MSKFVSVHANGKDGPVVTVTEAFAKQVGAKVLDDEPAVDTNGKPLPAREKGAYKNPPEPTFAPAITLPEDSEPKKVPDAPVAPEPPTPTGGPSVSQPEEATK